MENKIRLSALLLFNITLEYYTRALDKAMSYKQEAKFIYK